MSSEPWMESPDYRETEAGSRAAEDAAHARKTLTSVLRTVGVVPAALSAGALLRWPAVVEYVDKALSAFAQRAATAQLALDQATTDRLATHREVSRLHDDVRELRQLLAARDAELAELRANPDLATWERRARTAESALDAAGSALLRRDKWLTRLREQFDDLTTEAYEIVSSSDKAWMEVLEAKKLAAGQAKP